jgi:type I restriction enzyme S subunit
VVNFVRQNTTILLETSSDIFPVSARNALRAKQGEPERMKHLFTYGPVPIEQADKVKLKETETGDIPEHWNIGKIGDFANVKVSTSSVKAALSFSNSTNGKKLLFLKVSDMNHPLNLRRIITSASEFAINQDDLDNLNYISPGSIIFPKRGAAISTNKKRLTTCPCLLDPNLMAVSPKDYLNSSYLFNWFETFDLRKVTDDAVLPQLNKKDIEPVLIPIPPMQEQEQIVNQIEATNYKIDSESNYLTALKNIFASILNHLMTGKIRVKDL